MNRSSQRVGAGRRGWANPGWLVVALLVPVLSSCNQVRFLYDRADWLVERWVDARVDPTGQQLAQWRPVLAAGLERHRRLELPMLVEFLETVERYAEHGLERGEVTCLLDMADSIYRRHAQLAVEIAVPLLSMMSTEQVDHLAASLAEDADDDRKDFLAPDLRERAEKRTKRVTRRIERWTGRLDTPQRELVEAGLGGIPDLAPDWLEYRLAREAALLKLLYGGATAEELQRFLVDSWVNLDGRSPELKARLERARRQTIELLVMLDGKLSTAQRERFVRRVSDLREDFAEALPDEDPVRTADLPAEACATAG